MLKFYNRFSIIYHNNKKVGVQDCGLMLIDEHEKEKYIYIKELTWDNLNDWYYYNSLMCNFNIWTIKNYRVVSFFNFSLFNKNTWDIIEKKTPLNITIESKLFEKEMSIYDVLKWHDGNKALQYLRERNL